MNTVLRASAQKPLITDDLLKSPLVTKLIPPFWTSLTTLLTTNAQRGRNQTAAKFCWARLKAVVNASSTVTSQLLSSPLEQMLTFEQSTWSFSGLWLASLERVCLWPPVTIGQYVSFSLGGKVFVALAEGNITRVVSR